MNNPRKCPFCKSLPKVKIIGKVRKKYYIVCLDEYCMVNPCTELFVHEDDAINAWNGGDDDDV